MTGELEVHVVKVRLARSREGLAAAGLTPGAAAPVEAGATEPLPSTWQKSDPLLVYPLRLIPSDIWIQQRARRLTGMQASDLTDPLIPDSGV